MSLPANQTGATIVFKSRMQQVQGEELPVQALCFSDLLLWPGGRVGDAQLAADGGEVDPLTYYTGTLAVPGEKRPFTVVVTQLIEMGNPDAATSASSTFTSMTGHGRAPRAASPHLNAAPSPGGPSRSRVRR